MQNKPPLEWFQQLPEPYRTQAIENWEKSKWEDKHDLFESIRDAFHTFSWAYSQQGEDYWNSIFKRAIKGEFDLNLNGWIPVRDRLPTFQDSDELGDVLVISTDLVKKIANWVEIKPNNIKFWQPLPKLPEKI
jgi:hypothetical protein